jgi:hypothetical protein
MTDAICPASQNLAFSVFKTTDLLDIILFNTNSPFTYVIQIIVISSSIKYRILLLHTSGKNNPQSLIHPLASVLKVVPQHTYGRAGRRGIAPTYSGPRH